MVLVEQQQQTRGTSSRASDGMMMRDRGVVNESRGEIPTPGTLPPTGQPKVADSASPASPTRSSPSMAIGQFLKRIRTRSKSPAANKKASSSPHSASGLGHPSTSSSSPAWKADPRETEGGQNFTNGYHHVSPPATHPRQISTQYSQSNASHLSSGNIAHLSSTAPKSSTVPRAQSQDAVDCVAVTPARRTAPSRSSSRSRLKNWLSGGSTDDDGTQHHHGGKFSSWIGAKFSGKESPSWKSSAKRSVAEPSTNGGLPAPAVYGAAATLRDQAQRGALSEEDLVSKSLASEILSKGSTGVADLPVDPARNGTVKGPDGAMLTSYYSQDSVFDGPQKVPSYVRVSCALNGYRRFRPAMPPSPLSPGLTAGTSPRVPDTEAGHTPQLQHATPKGQSIVERRLERFNQPNNQYSPETPPSGGKIAVNGHENSERKNSAAGRKSSVKKLVGNFDRCDNPTGNNHSAASGPPEGGASANSALNSITSEQESQPRGGSQNSSAVAVAGSLGGGGGGGNTSSSLDTEAMVLTGGFSQSQKEEEEGSLLAEVLKATEQLMLNDGVEDGVKSLNGKASENPESSSPVQGGKKFEKLAAEERVKLEAKIEDAAKELDNDQIPSEGLDLIRIAYGKGKLLLNKKFSKYEELIQKNLNPIPNDPQPTKLDDLEGYWQLVKMELEDIDSHFQDYYRVKESGWDFSLLQPNEIFEAPKKPWNNARPPTSRWKAKKPPLPPTGPNKEARDRLRAAKLDAKKRMMEQQAKLTAAAQENGQEDVQIFVPV